MAARPAAPGDLTVAQVADELSVHYRTAYRWVRAGSLPARVEKGAYRIGRIDLDSFVERRQPSAGRRARLGGRTDAQVERDRDRVAEALLAGDESRTRSLLQQALGVASLTAVLDDIIAPSLREVGARWERGELGIWAEHRATATVSRILGELTPNPVGRRRGRAVVTSVAGDRHGLVTEMAVAALREDSWRVHHLGCDTPGTEIVDFCRTEAVDIVVISVTVSSGGDVLSDVRRQLDGLGIDMIVGGPGRRLSELQELARQTRRRDRPRGDRS